MLVVPPSSGTLRVIVSLVWLLAIHESAASSNSTVSDTKWSDLNGVSRENTYGIDILWRAPTSLEGFVASPSLVDVQGDGKVDIVIPCVAQCIEVVDGVSGRDFTSQWPFVSSHWRGALPAFTLDMDRDGWEDIFVVSMYGDMVVLDRFGTPIVNATWTLPTMYIAGEKEGPSIRSNVTQSAATRWQTLSTDSETHGNEKALHNERLSASENDVDEEDEDWEDEADAAPDPPSSNSSPPQYSMEALRSFSMLHAKHSKLCGMKDECTDDNDSFILERNSPFQSHHIERLYKDALIHFREQLSAEELQRLFTVDATAESLQDALHPHIYHNPAYTCMMDSSNECSPLAVISVVYFFDASLFVDTNIDLPSEESPNEKTQSQDELHGKPNETDGENSNTQQEKVVPRTPNLFVHAVVGVSLQSSMKVQWTTELHRWSETFASDRELHLSFTREFVSGSRKGPVIVDIDHDGEHEIVLAGQKNRRAVLWVLSMDGSVKCSTEAGITCQPPQWPQDVATDIPMDTSISTMVSTHLVVDDLDGDGLLDLCFGLTIQRQNDPSSQVEVRCYHMTPAFGAPMWRTPLVKSAGTISACSLTLTDLDGDGDLDLVFGTSNGFIYALKGATGALLWPDQYPHALGEGMLENGSQSIGIVSPITVVPLKAVYRSEGTDKQADASILTLIFTTTTGALVVADAATPKEPKRTQHFLLGEVSIASVVIGDVNHDGYLDLVVATLSGGLYLLSTNTPAAHMLSQPMALPRPFTNSVARVFPSDCMRGTMEQDGRVGAAAYLMLDPASIAYRDVMGDFFLLRWTIVDERRAVRMQQVSPAYRIVVRFGGVIHSNTSAAHTYGVDEKLSSAGSSTLYVGHYMTAGPHTEKIAVPRFSACGTVSVTLTLENSLSTVQTFSMSFNRNYRDLVRWLFLIPLVLFMAAISHVRIEDEVVLGDTHDEADDATFSDEDEDEELLALDRANGVALLYSTRGIRVIRV